MQNVKVIYQGKVIKVQFDYCPQCKYFDDCYDGGYPRYIDSSCIKGPVLEERGSNTMAKAILELEMPESCWQCKLGHYDELYGITHCDILRECMPYAGRRPDCPLKLVEEVEDAS